MMKKSAKFLSVILALAMITSVFSLTACNTEPPAHTHTYAATWTSDATNHWHAATCEHKTETKDKAAHDTKGADGACSVCGYKKAETPHTHTFDTEKWTSDATDHWHAATCEHTDEKGDLAEHGNWKYNACGTCGYVREHEHVNDKLEYGCDTHWFKASCCKVPSTRYVVSPHDTKGEGGKCSVCGFKEGWDYETKECILCSVCGGCIRGDHAELENPDHKICGHGNTIFEFEAEDATCPEATEGSFSDSEKYGVCFLKSRKNGLGVVFTIKANKACDVTLKLRTGSLDKGNDNHLFSKMFSVSVGEITNFVQSNAVVAFNRIGVEDAPYCFGWTTLGCISLEAGDNEIRVTGTLENGTCFDKMALLAPEGVTLTMEKTDNSAYTDRDY